MKIIEVAQGSPEWIAARVAHLCASDAPAMMGLSKHTKRTDLVRMKATGDAKEFSEWAKANLLEKGHEAEALARAIVEEMLGEDLYPVTGSDDAGRLLASSDGITMAGDTGFEHKLWNADLAAAIKAKATEFPGGLEWQLEQQILVGGLERVIFVCSNGTKEKFLQLEYRPVPGRAEKLLAGWAQFEEDVKNYQHVEVMPAARGHNIKDLPVIFVEIAGKVKDSNLAAYRETALKFIAGINTDLKTDQDFADAEATVKFCGDAEKKLDEAKTRALAQTATIAELFSTLDELRLTMRDKRLELNKLVEERKKALRAEILREGVDGLATHIASLNKRLGKDYMPAVPADFAGAMRAKKTIASLRDGVATELARAKILANAFADKIDINLKALQAAGPEHLFLFADLAQLVLKDPDDFAAAAKLRISDHKAKQEAQLAAERERIRLEEATRAAAATAPAAAAPAVVAAAPAPAGSSTVVPIRKDMRPTDDEIITALANHFRVTPGKALDWLSVMNFNAARARINTTTA